MKINSFKTGVGQSVDEWEEKLNIILPIDYKNFLTQYNGAKIEEGYFFVKGLNKSIMLDILFGSGLDKQSLNLEFWYEEFSEDIPENSLLIGSDPGGGFILLINDGKENGIYYYDHSYFFEESSDELNTYFIADNFTEFFNELGELK